MPAPYREKHFLEMSPRETEARKEEARQKDLQRSGRDAIEGAYPELVVNPASAIRAPAKAVEYIASKVLARPPKPLPPVEIGSRIRPDPANELFELLKEGPYKNATASELKQLKDELYAQRNKILLDRSMKRHAEVVKDQFLDKVDKALEAAYRRGGAEFISNNLDFYSGNANEGTPRPAQFRKGGVVKAKTHRGDGIAQRGKTKGRFV
jgi:hypothetical protein